MLFKILKWSGVVVLSMHLIACDMSNQDKLELERLRLAQQQQSQEHEAQVDRDRFAMELAEKELRKKEREESESRIAGAIHDALRYDVTTEVGKWDGLCSSPTITFNDGNVNVGSRDDTDRYFIASVEFEVMCEHMFGDDVRKKYIGKFYYNDTGHLKSSEWKLISKDAIQS